MVRDLDKDISEKYCFRFGKLAVEMGFITEAQLKDAIIEQLEDNLLETPHHRMLGLILFEKEWITPQQIDLVLNELFRRRKELKL